MAERATFTGFDPNKLTGVRVTDRKLGHGSYATVLELEYMGLKCAGKKIHELLLEQGDTSYTLRRFEEECRLLSQVRHPNIVQFLGVYFQQRVRAPILVMEFLPTNLTSCIEQHGILPKEISYSILHDVALGLCYLHSQTPPIIHRDLSSNNVLLTPNMTAKISDLGVARILNLTPLQVSRMTQTPGTPAYMPPEVMVANPNYNTSVDEFSYGIMMIHMFSGQWPEPQVGPNSTESDGRLIPVSEAERREVFLRAIGNDHPLIDKILRCIDNDPKRRVHATELLESTSALKHEFPVAVVNYLEMQTRVKASEEEKRTLKEEGDARVQNKEQQIARLGDEIQQKTEMIERQDLAHQNEIMQMQQQVEDANAQAELQKDLTEAKVEEAKSLSSQVETLSEEKKTSEQTLKTLRTEILTLQSNMSRLSQQVSSLELENLTLKQNLSASDDALKVKTSENEAVAKALKKKDAIISEKSEQLIKATEYIISKKQVLLTSFDWKRCANLPTERVTLRYQGVSTVFNGKVYYGGGMSYFPNNKEEYIVYCYDPLQDKWTTLPPLPFKYCGLGHVNGKVVAVGGKVEQAKLVEATDRMCTYDERSQKWKQTIPPMPTARWFPGVLSLQSALVVAGGETRVTKKSGIFGRTSHVTTQLDTIEIFKPDVSQWYQTNSLPTACCRVSFVVIGNTCHAFGGNSGSYYLDQALYASVDDLLLNAVPANQTTHSGSSDTQSAWKTLPNTPRYHPAAAVLAGNLLAIGGQEMPEDEFFYYSSDYKIYVYIASTNTWAYCGDLSLPATVQQSHVTVSILSPIEIMVIAENTAYKGTPMFF